MLGLRKKLALGLVPVILAALATFASPGVVVAAAAVTETGVTTYTVNPTKSVIEVRVVLSIHNNTPNSSCGYMCVSRYYYVNTYAWVELEATNVKATSNAGKVKASVAKNGKWFREWKLTYPAVYYGQTRVVTLTYTIPGAPGAKGGYRAVKAYAELCAAGNGHTSGRLNVVIPTGFSVSFYSGQTLTASGSANGMQTWTSGNVSEPYKLWSCLEAEDPTNLDTKTLTVAGQTFSVLSWPEDTGWATTVAADVSDYAPKLEELTGFELPGGTIKIQEAGNSQLGDYAGGYSALTKTATVIEGTDGATIAHELSHIWFNKSLLSRTWVTEGLAGYSEQVAGPGNYKPCNDPGQAPATLATLSSWRYLDVNSTDEDEDVVDWQYDASCYVITEIAGEVGADGFRAILMAVKNHEIAYVGAGPAETGPDGTTAIPDQAFLDIVDERGMIPAGVADLDKTQTLFSRFGITVGGDLAARSKARTAYHALATEAGAWKLPYAIRKPMAAWDFATATSAMDTATQILALRDKVMATVAGVKLDGSPLQTAFEGAQTQVELDAALELAKKEAAAADLTARAIGLNSGARGFFEMIGLIGSDPGVHVTAATEALTAANPDEASAAAQRAIDMIDASANQGMMRLGGGLGVLLGLLVILLGFWQWRRRRRRAALAAAGPAFPYDPSMFGGVPSAPDPAMSSAVWTPPSDGATPPWLTTGAGNGPDAGPPAETVWPPADTLIGQGEAPPHTPAGTLIGQEAAPPIPPAVEDASPAAPPIPPAPPQEPAG